MGFSYDLVLLHAPSNYNFRDDSVLSGPISDVVPSSPIFEMYPVGLTSIAELMEQCGFKVKLINIANRMLCDENFDVEKKLRNIKTKAFGIDLHWLPHAHGSIELAKVCKKLHPDVPVIFGGLSATYYHKELLDYSCIDFVMRGDSTEKLTTLWMDHLKKGGTDFSHIPNLSWKNGDEHVHNEHVYVPSNFDDVDVPGYRYSIKSVFKYWNFYDPLPYKGWLSYPNTAILSAKGCTNKCIICGSSNTAANINCKRPRISKRSPQRIIDDILFIQRFSRAPIFILGDVRQCGRDYADEFIELLKANDIKNEIVFEMFQYVNEDFYKRLNEALPKKGYSLECTLETHDYAIRKHNGKMACTNEKAIETMQHALKHGCKKIDIFFMTGIPDQTYDSAMKNIDFVEEMHIKCGYDTRISYFVAPLAPFLDPACKAFEEPEKYGYVRICKTLEDHRSAICSPSWKYMLSYETTSMTRDDIVNATYDSASKLNDFKLKHNLVDEATHKDVKSKIVESKLYIEQIDKMMLLPEDQRQAEIERIRNDIKDINRHSICGKDELKWESKKHFANVFSLAFLGLELLVKEIFKGDTKARIKAIEEEVFGKTL